MWTIIELAEAASTNDYIKGIGRSGECGMESAVRRRGRDLQEQSVVTSGDKGELGLGLASRGLVVVARSQTAGRGHGTNVWESASGKNLTFSVRLPLRGVAVGQQFGVSMAAALAVARGIEMYVRACADDPAIGECYRVLTESLRVKWPNDIYVADRKLGGILIETTLAGRMVSECVIGIGVNVNQERFLSDAPNPVSLRQICPGAVRAFDIKSLLDAILQALERYISMVGVEPEALEQEYLALLYRREGLHAYRDKNGEFRARFVRIEPNGHLVLCDTAGTLREYEFKQVRFV